jgi:hypothetical protein
MKIVYEDKELTFPSLADPPVKCCRCYPNSISSKGYCGCCDFDHATGVRESFYDPEFDDPQPAPEVEAEADPEE